MLNLVHSRLLFVGFALVPIVAGLAQTSGSYTVRALIGSGSRGDGGPAVSALLDGPYGLAEDAQGNVYISESNRGVIRRVGANGIIQQFAGSGILDDGPQGQPALQTDLISPGSLLIDSDGGLIFADNGACRIRKVSTRGNDPGSGWHRSLRWRQCWLPGRRLARRKFSGLTDRHRAGRGDG